MKPKSATAAKKGRKPATDTGTTVSLRVKKDHLQKLDEYAAAKGIARASAIQIAIAELLERWQN